MTAFREAIEYTIAQTRFYYSASPWHPRAAIQALTAIIDQTKIPDTTLYTQITEYCAQLPRKQRYLQTRLDNVLAIYHHSVQSLDLSTLTILDATEVFKDWHAVLPDCRGKIVAIGYNADSHLHVIKVQQNHQTPRTVYLHDPLHQFAAQFSLHQHVRHDDVLLTERKMLSNYPPLTKYPRKTLMQWVENPGKIKVVSIVEPDHFCLEGEVILQNEKGTLDTISLQGNYLFLGESIAFSHDEHILFHLEDDTEKQMPIRVWHKPWQTLLHHPSQEKKKSASGIQDDVLLTVTASTPHSPTKSTQKIMIALHGIFDHKGAYHELAKTLLAHSDTSEPLLVIAADWPTYGASTDRDQPMPPFAVMKQYLMALLHHVAATYPDSELYLLAESLGASMIFICSEEIKAFQSDHACLKGVIAISPAIHDPTTNLYLQRRFIGYSTSFPVFRSIWFHDPEVNHQHAASRIRATIPYLSEAYRGMQRWPNDIPCAVLLASNDSVVTKAPFLRLYRLFQSLETNPVIFYAFPTRHLLLRSRPEGGKYLDRQFIHGDVFALIQLMNQNQLSQSSVLPASGATSTDTMQWFHRIYQNLCGSSCVGKPVGHLTDWPCHPSLYSALSLPKETHKPRSIKKEAVSPHTLLGVFSDAIHAADFIEHSVVGDGDCGFHVLGITRQQLVRCILSLQDDLATRKILAPEIRAAILSNDIPESIQPMTWKTAKSTYRTTWNALEATMADVKAHIEAPYPGEFGLRERVLWLREQTEAIEEQSALTEALAEFEKNNTAIDALCESSEAFVVYITLYQIPKTLWLGYQTALLWARASQISVTIWRKNPDAADELVLLHTYEAPHPRNTIHMLHTSGFTHFNLLELTKTRNLAEERALILKWNNTQTDWSLDHTLYELFNIQTRKTPDAIAIISSNKALTYAEVLIRANRIAHALKSVGAVPNQLVGILMHKGWEQIVACLGVVGSGAAFLPMDADWPIDRIRQVMTQGDVNIVLTQQAVLTALEASDLLTAMTCFTVDQEANWKAFPTTTLSRQQAPGDIAYVIFTSGSTGQPKGVVISHENAVNTLFDINQRFHVNVDDRILALSNLSFDLAVYDIFGILSAGAALVLPDADKLKEPAHWLHLITTHHITLWNTVPMFMQMLLEYLDCLPDHARPNLTDTIRLSLLSGDWIPLNLPDRVQHYFLTSQLISLGGATEGSIWSILYPVEALNPHWKSIPYGLPMRNQHLYVLDEDLHHCPIGKVGEIHIGGAGVALGYWKDEERTTASFITHPKTRERLYKTGDLGCWSEEGFINFIGRKDTQVKIQGHRIELGEIESALTTHPYVEQCVVAAFEQGQQEQKKQPKQLVAYVVPNREQVAKFEKHTDHDQDWREVYDGIYQMSDEVVDPMFNIAGWRSSYTGELLTEVEMREWVNHTVNRILALKPKRVLEIGCGTGLLASRVAPYCETYVATDISATSVAMIEALKVRHADLRHIVTHQRPANDFSGWSSLAVDIIVINSVVQCFSSVEYLLEVIEQAVQLLQPNGQLFIGDVRHLGLLEAYHASVQLHKATHLLSKSELRRKVQTHLAHEEELLIDPTFFYAIKHRIPRLSHTQVQLKAGHFPNELNRFRYDVTLYVNDEPTPTLIPHWQDWQDSLSSMQKHVRTWKEALDGKSAQVIGIRAIPNARLSTESITLNWMYDKAEYDFGLTDNIKTHPTTGIDPHAILQWGETLGLHVELRWHYANPQQYFDALFIYQPPSLTIYPAIACADACCDVTVWQNYVNYPLLTKLKHDLVPELLRHLSSVLPPYMLPTTFLLLPHMPLSANGKVDRKALPTPTRNILSSTEMNAAHTETEKQLLSLFCEALNLDTMGIHDNFFNLGGNSLRAVHLMMRINQQFKINHPVSTLFMHQSVASLAKILQTREKAANYRPILTFNEKGQRPPIFFVHSGRGGAEAYVTLASHFDPDQPVHVIESYNLCNEPPFLESIEAMATQYLRFVQAIQPDGPYYLGGWSLGGLIAYEMAQQLVQLGHSVPILYLLDVILNNNFESKQLCSGIESVLQKDPYYEKFPIPYRDRVKTADRIQFLANFSYRPKPYLGNVMLLKASDTWAYLDTPEFRWGWVTRKFMHHAFSKKHNGWSKLIPHLKLHPVPGHHQSIMEGENAQVMANVIQEDCLARRYTQSTISSVNTPQALFYKKPDAPPTASTRRVFRCCIQ